MNAVLGMANLLLDENLTFEQMESVRYIIKSGDALLSVISDILDFSKVESGHLTSNMINMCILDTIQSSVDLLQMGAHEKNITIIWEIADEVPLFVNGDDMRIRQILINLLSNAGTVIVKY